MTTWTPERFADYMEQYATKMKRGQPPVCDALAAYDAQEKADEGKESRLAGKIMKDCKDLGWPCQCFRQSRKARGFLVPGWWD